MEAELPQYARTPTQHQHRTSRASGNSTATASRHGSSSRTPTEHLYHLTSSKGSPWLTLKVSSNAPGPTYLPVFYEGEAIGGTVALHREKEDAIRSISVKVIGQMTSSVTDVLNFVQVSETLWDSSTPSSTSSGSSHPTRLVGHYSWPFSIVLPNRCEVKSSSGESQLFALPGSFTERLARVHIQYQIIVTVHRSRFRVDSTLGTVFGYCPIIRPEAPSVARQLAYLNNMPLPGPEADPDGWRCLDPLRIRGSVFSTRSVDAICTLALAKPLCYTRGSVIPCVMTVETTDPQALDLLSAPRSPVVRLLRQIATGEATLSSSGGKKLPGLEYERVVQDLTTAVWAPDTARQPHRRTLHGEIHLSAGLKPTSRLGKFELSYTVVVYPPKAAAFQPDSGDDTILQQEPVVIGTVYAPGPRPIVHSPPGYDDAKDDGRLYLTAWDV